MTFNSISIVQQRIFGLMISCSIDVKLGLMVLKIMDYLIEQAINS